MINMSDVGGLYQSMPENIKDVQTKAFMYACDRQIGKLLDRVEKIKVWCNIENVDEKYLDYMAAECRALMYESALAVDVKRDLIVNSQYWHTKLGTFSAMEEIINSAYPKNETVIREWFEYGGKPYFFKIYTDADMDEESMAEFYRMISTVKNARSLLDGFEISRNLIHKLFLSGTCVTESHINIGWREH